MAETRPNNPLWQPSPERIKQTNMCRFMAQVERDWNVTIETFAALHRFSVNQPEKFWTSIKDFCGVIGDGWGDNRGDGWGKTVLVDGDKMPGAKWFPEARLNFAENLLRRRGDGDAIIFQGEDKSRYRLTHDQLYDQVSLMVQAFSDAGVGVGDRVCGYLPNIPEAVVCMLAAVSLGATWSSCSPDFGIEGVVDRFGQIEPTIMIAADGYYYNGKTHDSLEKTAAISSRIASIKHVIIVPYTRALPQIDAISNAVLLDDFVDGFTPDTIDFVRLAFDHPLYVMYSSGTTGVPKCIIHGAGGSLFQHLKEHILHCDIHPGDPVFFFTTCGWMMWNWLVAALASEATLLLYDGSPFYPDSNAIFKFADDEKATLLGTSAKFIDALAKAGATPGDTYKLDRLRLIASTGSPLSPEGFDYVYDNIKSDLQLASISGGTDIMACFILGDPTGAVWRGEIQAPALGMAIEVFDEDGKPVTIGKGELVCTRPFPSMPVGFWNDADGGRYHAAYFEKFPNVWCHGDWIERTEHGGYIVHGRSDATLNPGGVRIGTAEIYRQVEKLDEVIECIVIGQQWDYDTRIVLFAVLRDGITLDDGLVDKIKQQIRDNCTARHVPAVVLQVADIPRTKSGKITELAVRDVVHGRVVKNKEALANPDALELFAGHPELSGG